MSTDPVARVLDALAARGMTFKREGAGFVACCPAHDDARPSLAIGRGRSGDALVFCRSAGCSAAQIVQALDMTLLDLKADATPLHFPTIASPQADERRGFPTANAAAAWLKSKHGRWSQRHTYTNAAGEPLGIVLRWDSTDAGGARRKHFAPVWRFGDSWRITCPPSGRPLYALSELGSHGRVFVVEGEKCADILHRIGVCATTSSFGARSAFKSCWEPLAGREACLLPDADDGGHAYALEVKGLIEALTPSARVRIVHLPSLRAGTKDDVEQWLENRHHGDADSAFHELQSLAHEAFRREGGVE